MDLEKIYEKMNKIQKEFYEIKEKLSNSKEISISDFNINNTKLEILNEEFDNTVNDIIKFGDKTVRYYNFYLALILIWPFVSIGLLFLNIPISLISMIVFIFAKKDYDNVYRYTIDTMEELNNYDKNINLIEENMIDCYNLLEEKINVEDIEFSESCVQEFEVLGEKHKMCTIPVNGNLINMTKELENDMIDYLQKDLNTEETDLEKLLDLKIEKMSEKENDTDLVRKRIKK